MYKNGLSLPLVRCVTAHEATKNIEEIHEGVCRNHIGGKTLALKALRAGYWPTMPADAQAYVKNEINARVLSKYPSTGESFATDPESDPFRSVGDQDHKTIHVSIRRKTVPNSRN